MAPKPNADESDGLPDSSDDDEEKAVPKKSGADESATAPLLSAEGTPSDAAKPAATDSKPATPRDRFRDKSRSTPRGDNAAAPSAEPPALDVSDVTATAGAAVEELSNVRAPTKEELEGSKASAQQQIDDAKAEGKRLLEEMLADAPPPISLQKLPESKRMEMYIDQLAEKAGGKADALKPCVITTIRVGLAIQPWLEFIAKWAMRLWALVPHNLAIMVFGAALCYFGGVYFVSIAAVEAFRTMGGQTASREIEKLQEDVDKVMAVSKEDDLVDDDGDGIADVEQISAAELVRRKLFLVGVTIEEPQRIQVAIANLWAASIAVLATLRIEFAATTAMALGIVDMVKFPAVRMVTPMLLGVLGPRLKHWCTPLIESTLVLVIVIVAWYAKSFVAAFYAALRGGRLFAQGFFGLIVDQAHRGVVICPGIVGKEFDPNESVLDEVVGYIIAVQGLMFQLTSGFSLHFPFNLLLLPLTVVDWSIATFLAGGG